MGTKQTGVCVLFMRLRDLTYYVLQREREQMKMNTHFKTN